MRWARGVPVGHPEQAADRVACRPRSTFGAGSGARRPW
jgi:hypothetical protein